jgi:ATP-binding cassette subfamily C protein
LVNGSIRDNLTRYCGENVTDEQLWRALDTVFLSDFVKTLPEELDSPIINDASNFSGGQRQRLNLAAALVENFDILILDEPTSNLNEDLEADIFRRILDTYNNRTIIYITHSEQIKLKSEKVIYIQ